MLSRTADNLFWLARYMERAESMARILEAGYRLAAMGSAAGGGHTEWHSTIVAAGCERGFYEKHRSASTEAAIDYLARDPDNPSSIISCIQTARRNGRAVRTALTADMWDAVNGSWLQARNFEARDFTPDGVRRVLDWVKERSLLFSGCVGSTMMRNDAYWFTRLGTFVERADNTARILDVKYNVLLPTYESVGGGLDYVQWTAVLHAVSASRAYHWIYRREVKPWLVAELLILKPEMPRSLAACFVEIARTLELLAAAYGRQGEADRVAGQIHARLRFTRIDDIFQTGLHEFLTNFIDSNIRLGTEISKQYLT
ncbi:MAG: alpha-E domain-containing protein [Alphaproteobacteria bacterium]